MNTFEYGDIRVTQTDSYEVVVQEFNSTTREWNQIERTDCPDELTAAKQFMLDVEFYGKRETRAAEDEEYAEQRNAEKLARSADRQEAEWVSRWYGMPTEGDVVPF